MGCNAFVSLFESRSAGKKHCQPFQQCPQPFLNNRTLSDEVENLEVEAKWVLYGERLGVGVA